MSHSAARLLLVLVLLGFAASEAHAHDTYVIQGPAPVQPYGYGYAPPPAYAPVPVPYAVPYREPGSIFGFGYRGMFTGTLAGLGVSYFVAQSNQHVARDLGLSLGIGALAGTGLGLTLGVLDQVGLSSAYYVSRDLTYGVFFGATVGAIAGGVSALAGGAGKDVAFGAATGSLSGLGLGLIVGLIEGQFRTPRGGAFFGGRANLSFAQVAPDSRAWGVRLSGRL